MHLQDSKFAKIETDAKIIHKSKNQLLEILAPSNGSYDFLRDPALLTSTEVALFFMDKQQLSLIYYNTLLNYLNSSGWDYHAANVDYYCADLSLAILPWSADFPKQFTFEGKTYSVQSKREASSHIQFYISGSQNQTETGCIQEIWQLPLEYRMHTFLLIKQHVPLSTFGQNQNPYSSEPCSFLKSNLVEDRLTDHTLIIEPNHIICHLAVYKWPAGTFGISCKTMAITWSLNRDRH
ncbi:hypothetical protein GYMLUDRAFT_157503 [Collybiopsis luxurians FD-317 M1]|nr:hypothetical protein GYMLUDRAFT_157503 [Collybiopsis luxurians FD-317 M1]